MSGEETQDFEKLSIKGTFSNDTQYFKNNVINSELNTKTKNSLIEEFKSIYEENLTPVDEIEKIIYKQFIQKTFTPQRPQSKTNLFFKNLERSNTKTNWT